MAKMTILRGVSGSGKSTWARQQNAVVVSRDAIRDMLFPVHADNHAAYYAQDKAVLSECEQTVTIAQDALIASALKAGKDVIVDNTNTEWKFVKALAKIGYRHGADVEVKVFDVPLNTAIGRDDRRGESGGRHVGVSVIANQHSRLQGTKNKQLEPVKTPQPYNGTPGKPDAFMFDLDGTVYHMNGKRGPYDHNVDVDDPDEAVQTAVRTLWMGGLVPVAMSGRKEATRETTEACLDRDDVPFDALFMRADEDNRADNLIKADLFDENVRDNYNVLFVIDDRAQVVRMWQAMGIKVLNVAGSDGGEF